METQFLFFILFFTGIIPIISSVPRKYYFIKSGKTWSDARAYCQANDEDLAIINSAANMLRLQTDAQGTLNNLNILIGMYLNPSSFLWSYRNESLGGFTNWMTGYPNYAGGKLSCVLLTQLGWYNVVCTLLRAFICYDDRRTGADRYIYYSTVKTWSEAQSFCRQDHTDLASARTATEHSDIMGKISGDTWFGLFREPWKWLD
ncbi:C-type lectin lectoxin-Phi1-like [Trichomycterus rosablanca]|uniref:C-type lectin lectoxin-Phi1-like n=1 Tax=Trichomycterus rosablanca TaxID=2290929 RepID=UPI002F354CB2